jgi:hypothetical protein
VTGPRRHGAAPSLRPAPLGSDQHRGGHGHEHLQGVVLLADLPAGGVLQVEYLVEEHGMYGHGAAAGGREGEHVLGALDLGHQPEQRAARGRAVCEQLLDRWRSVLGPDRPDTLAAASDLTLAHIAVGEAERVRALGQDTLQRCRRMLGPESLITLWPASAVTQALAQLGEAKPARALGQDTLQRYLRVFGPNHLITLSAGSGLTLALV